MDNDYLQPDLVVKTVGLSKKFKETYAVREVCMHIKKGDIYGFVGENGAGKTTIIRLLSGLVEPTSGTFCLFGEERSAALGKRRVAGIVESVSLNKGMTALENLKSQCFISGIKKTDEELKEALRAVRLDPDGVAKKKVRNYSLGMKQRLGIAMVIIQEPEFVLLDEPMNGLDPQGFIDMRETILDLNGKGITFLISSHLLSELDKICNRIGIISKGVLVDEILVEDLHKLSGVNTVITLRNGDFSEEYGKLLQYPVFSNSRISGNEITVTGDADVNDVMAALVSEKIKISSLTVKETSVEDYYIEKVRG